MPEVLTMPGGAATNTPEILNVPVTAPAELVQAVDEVFRELGAGALYEGAGPRAAEDNKGRDNAGDKHKNERQDTKGGDGKSKNDGGHNTGAKKP